MTEDDWEDHDPPFDKLTALRIVSVGDDESSDGTSDNASVYDFFINEDNFYLKSDLKTAGEHEKLVKSQFTYGMVLTGLALLHQHHKDRGTKEDTDDGNLDDAIEPIETRVENVTKALAPFIVPMIEALGTMEVSEDFVEESSDEAA